MVIKKARNSFTGFFICVTVTLLLLAVTQEIFFPFESLKTLELKVIDNMFTKRGDINISDSSDVIILEITQDTYEQLPANIRSWPWPRSIFANLIENLNEAGVKAIGIDLVMSSSDQYDNKNDSLLLSAIKKYRNVVVAGKLDIEREQIIDNIRSGKIKNPTGIIRKKNENFGNIFYSADSSIGIVNVPSDYDGVYRTYKPYVSSSVVDQNVPTFSFAVLNKYFGLPANHIADNLDGFFSILGLTIPKFNSSSVLINYYSLEKNIAFKHVKLIDVIDDKDFKTVDEIDLEEDGITIDTWDNPDYGILHSGLFKDKIVLIGSTMPEDKDQMPVSISNHLTGQNLMYGVKLHASMIQNVLDRNYIFRQSKFLEIVQIILFTFFAFYISSFLKRIKQKRTIIPELISVSVLMIISFIYYKLCNYMFIEKNYLITYINPILAMTFGYFSSTAYNFIRERQQNAIIKGMFGYYVSPQLVSELIADPDKLKLGGEDKNLTILFSDIVGFSTLSEKMSASELVTLMNEYLSAMTEIVLENNGTLDKYIGDAVMAFWGAPISIDDHAYQACKSAIIMRRKVEDLQIQWDMRGIPMIDIRIGINSGDVVVGNMGGEKRFDYTVMGDEVNLASRLEGANKQYSTYVMISESTYNEVNEQVVARELDTIIVKGKTKPTTIFELIGLKEDKVAQVKLTSLDLYFEGLGKYKLKQFDEALKIFDESYLETGDPTSKIYSERCKFYIANPPDENWDGVFTMTTK